MKSVTVSKILNHTNLFKHHGGISEIHFITPLLGSLDRTNKLDPDIEGTLKVAGAEY
jgi:hypothetical protein